MARKSIPNYVIATIIVSLGGILNGFDTGSIGAAMTMKQFKESIGDLSPSLLGFSVSLIMLTGSFPAVFAGYMADKLGRLKLVMAGVVVFAIGAYLQGTAYTLTQFLVGRGLAGFGEGMFLSNINVYVCEIAPVKHRGILAGVPQFMVATAICLGYFTCYGSVSIQSSVAWRLPFLIQGSLAVAIALACFVLPDSPRWLVLCGDSEKALRALDWLGLPPGETDFMTSIAAVQHQPSIGYLQSVLLLFKRGYRSRTYLALFILGMVQLSGIDGVLYYAPALFSQAGLPSESATFLASGLSAILMLAITIPAFLFADKWGRRTSAITGGLGLSICMFLIGSLYAADVVHPYGVARWAVIVSVFVFGLIYCGTWAIMGKIYASEIQQPHTRAAANCVAQGLNFFTNWLVAILTPILLDKSAFGAYFLFGGIALSTVPILFVYMPETRGRSLESIQEVFHRPKFSIRSITSGVGDMIRRRRGQGGQTNRLDESEIEMVRQASNADAATSSIAPGLRLELLPN